MARNLNSLAQCIPKLGVTFQGPARHEGALQYFDVADGRECYILLLQLVQGDFDTDGQIEAREHVGDAITQPIIRDWGTRGELRVIEGAAVESEGQARPVNVMHLGIPRYGAYWFWTTRDVTSAIAQLTNEGHVKPTRVFTRSESGPTEHGQLYMMLWTTFDMAVALPDSSEYKKALEVIDADAITPSAPQNALQTVSNIRYLSRRRVERSLADDRYAAQLQDWEVYVAERANVSAAEYLEVRRLYMSRFHEAVLSFRSNNGLTREDPQRRFGDWKNRVDFLTTIRRDWDWPRRRTLISAFDELGMLDESKFV